MELLDSNKYPEYYSKVYGSFMKIYNCETEDSWLESNVSDLVLSFKENQDVPLRILSIGSGSGGRDLAVLNGLRTLNTPIIYTVVEPAEGHIKLFKEKVSNQPSNVSFEYHQMSCEEFYKYYPERKFHLVHMIHVLYYMEDFKEVIKIYADMLYKGGTILVLMDSYNSGFGKIRSDLSQFFPPELRPSCLQDIESAAKELHLMCNHIECESFLDVTNMLTEGDEVGQLLFDLFTNTYKFCETAPDHLINKFTHLLQSRKITKDGKHLLPWILDVFIIKYSNSA